MLTREGGVVSVSAFEIFLQLAAALFRRADGFVALGRVQPLVELFDHTQGAVALGKEGKQRRATVRQHMTGGAASGAAKAVAQNAARRTARSRAGSFG